MDWNKIRNEWEATNITLTDLAEKHGVKLGTLKSRKSREKWSRDATNKDATKSKKVATPKEQDASSENSRRYKPGSRKGAGNPNPKNQFTERNSAALKHGLFSRYIPKETLEIMGMMEKDNPADLLWDQIMIQYAAIIRAQSIMHVESKDEMIKELKKHKMYEDGEEIEYEFQFAWERQAQFLNAQSRAMSELRSLIKQFNEMATEDDERRLKLELMQTQIDKTKTEITKLQKDDNEQQVRIIIEDDVHE